MPSLGFPGGTSGKEPACQCRRHKRSGFDPWVGTNSWRRTWQPTQYFCLDTPMDRGPWRLQSTRWQRVRRDWRDLARVPFLFTWIHIRLETDESLAKRIFLFLIAGLVVSKPDLVTFLEQMKTPWDERRLETPAVYTGRCEWMEPMSQRQVQGLVRNSSFVMWFGKICFNGNGFREVCVSFCCCHRRISPAPFCLFKSFLKSSPVISFLNHSENRHPSLGLWQPAWIDYYSISWVGVGVLGKLHISEKLYDAPIKVCTSRWQCVSGIVDMLPNF